MCKVHAKPQTSRLIIKTSVLTLLFAFAIFSYGLFFFGIAFPRVMAEFCDTLGAYDAAGMYYEHEYKANPSIENLYLALDRYIMAPNYGKIIEYSEKFYGTEDFNRVIAGVNQDGWKKSGTDKLSRLKYCNEDNRIKYMYTAALLKTKKTSRAESNLRIWLEEGIENPDLQQPNHAFMASKTWHIETEQLFITYVEKIDEKFNAASGTDAGEKIFALDFLIVAYARLGNLEKAGGYVQMFNSEVSNGI